MCQFCKLLKPFWEVRNKEGGGGKDGVVRRGGGRREGTENGEGREDGEEGREDGEGRERRLGKVGEGREKLIGWEGGREGLGMDQYMLQSAKSTNSVSRY